MIAKIDEEQAREGALRELFGEWDEGSIAPVKTFTSYIDSDQVQWADSEAIRRATEEERLAPYRDLIERIDNPTFEDAVDGVLQEVKDLIVDRQRTYGPSNIEQQGIFGVVNRIGMDKLARIRQRLNGEVFNGEIVLDGIELGSVNEPGIINDLADVIGYAVCGILLLRGEWGRPLAGDE